MRSLRLPNSDKPFAPRRVYLFAWFATPSFLGAHRLGTADPNCALFNQLPGGVSEAGPNAPLFDIVIIILTILDKSGSRSLRSPRLGSPS